MTEGATESLQEHRGYLRRLAYRMLGEVSEAEDVVQDAYFRWHATERDEVNDPKAFLSTVVTRLCLDRLKEARRQRETYVGAWLPEPLVEDLSHAQNADSDMADDISFALMLALERATFLLHDVFDVPFEEIAAALHRTAPACRQLASRARGRVRAATPRFAVQPHEGVRLAEAFFAASRSGDTSRLQDLLAETAIFHSDGGGKKTAALRPINGRERICRLLMGLARKSKAAKPLWKKAALVNGLPGFITVECDGTLQTTALEITLGRIAAVYVIRNPQKLLHILPLLPAAIRPSVTLNGVNCEQ